MWEVLCTEEVASHDAGEVTSGANGEGADEKPESKSQASSPWRERRQGRDGKGDGEGAARDMGGLRQQAFHG